MRIYIHDHQTEFIPAGLDPADVADAVQEPSLPSASPALADYTAGEGDDTAHRAREQDQRGLQWAYDTLEGTLSVARQSFAGAIELLRDAWENHFSPTTSTTTTSSSSATTAMTTTPSTSTILYAVIAVLVLSNLWTLTLVGKRDKKDAPLVEPRSSSSSTRQTQTEEREKWVQGIVAALWQELEAGRQPAAGAGTQQPLPPPPPSSSSEGASASPPIVPPAVVQLPEYWHEEVAQLRMALDTVEERVRAVRQSLAELD
jgi:hypothetical protein